MNQNTSIDISNPDNTNIQIDFPNRDPDTETPENLTPNPTDSEKEPKDPNFPTKINKVLVRNLITENKVLKTRLYKVEKELKDSRKKRHEAEKKFEVANAERRRNPPKYCRTYLFLSYAFLAVVLFLLLFFLVFKKPENENPPMKEETTKIRTIPKGKYHW